MHWPAAKPWGRWPYDHRNAYSSVRTLSVPAFLVQELAQHLDAQGAGTGPSDLAFHQPRGGPLRPYLAERVFKPAVKASGLDPALTFYGLRHAAATILVGQGEYPRVIHARLGYATARLSMELYAHVPEAADRQVTRRLNDEWSATVTGTWAPRGQRRTTKDLSGAVDLTGHFANPRVIRSLQVLLDLAEL
jgi:integrase